MKLSIKAAVVIFSVALIALLGTSSSLFFLVKSSLQTAIGDNQLETARQTMDKIDRLLHERFINIQALADGENLEPVLEAVPSPESISALKKRIQKLTVLTGPWDVLHIVSKEGTILVSSDKKNGVRSIQEFPYQTAAFNETLKGNTYYSDHVIAVSTGKPTVIFAAPIRSQKFPDHPVIGSVIGYFAWPAVNEILEDTEAHAVLLNQEGHEIGSNVKHLRNSMKAQLLSYKNAPNAIVSSRAGSIVLPAGTGFMPVETLASIALQQGYLSYKGSGWKLVFEVPSAIAFAQATRTAVSIALFSVPAILLVSGVILFLMIYFVVKPIVLLTQMTKVIAQGDLSRQVKILSKDEIGELGSSFNTMTLRLRESYAQLEEKVKQRTQLLSKANEDLTKEIADRKRLENAILQSEKMAAVGQLAGGVAHEINNPLGVILGFSQNMAKRIKPGDPFELSVKSIEREAIRCKNLVRDLLTFSRAGKTEMEILDLQETIEGALSLVLAQSKVKNVTLVKEIGDAPKILANRNQIQQVIVNLSNNAIDAMSKGGCLTIRTGKTKVENKAVAQIEIEDTGAGIPQDLVSKIFEPFFTTKEVGKGTGLGLSLVYEILQKHEGTIRVQSEVGKGTIFFITLPAA